MEFVLMSREFFVDNFLKQPACFIGLVVGCFSLKKPCYDCPAAAIKAALGYFILVAGAGGLVKSFCPILPGLNDQFNMSVTIIDPYFGQSAVTAGMESIGRSFSQVMILLLFAFIFNLLPMSFQKYTKLQTVLTTGKMQQAAYGRIYSDVF